MYTDVITCEDLEDLKKGNFFKAGGALIVTDDYFGKREDAESTILRDKIWDAYTNNIFTRRDDPSINLITGEAHTMWEGKWEPINEIGEGNE